MKKIYIITTMTKIEEDKDGFLDVGGSRVVGYYFNKEDAIDTIKQNMGDLWETIYDYAIVEEVKEGIYPYCKNRWLFKYNIDKDEYVEIEELDIMKHTVNFAIG